jgi:hypothetical protein
VGGHGSWGTFAEQCETSRRSWDCTWHGRFVSDSGAIVREDTRIGSGSGIDYVGRSGAALAQMTLGRRSSRR